MTDRIPDLTPRNGTPTAIAEATKAAEKEARIAALAKAAAAIPSAPTLGDALEAQAQKIGELVWEGVMRREVGKAHDAVVLALAGTNPFVAMVAIDLVRKQYADMAYASHL